MARPAADLVHHLAEFVVDSQYTRIPGDAVDAAKKSVLDTLGVMLAAGGMEPAARGVVDLVRESGGRPEASVIGFGGKVPAMMAAFANGALAHCLDFDDQTPWGQHASSSIVPAAFAVAELRGDVSGQDMIAAVAAGQDVFARLRCNVGWRMDWNLSTVVGVFAATATAGGILGLSREQMINAFGIASMQSCGVMEIVGGIGGDLRALYAGFSAKGAVISALLAKRGITAVETLFEGPTGVFSTYFGGRYDRDAMLEELGIDYKGGVTLYKRWPAVGTAHSHIHATIELMRQHELSAADIDEIFIYVGDYHEVMCHPPEARRAPTTLVDAKFSLPFLVAVAAVRHDVRLSDFTTEALKDPEILAVAQKVVTVADEALDWKLELPAGRVEIVMRDGRRFERLGTGVPGSSEAPLTWDDIERKFGDCASAAVVPPSEDQVKAVKHMAANLESLDDVTELLRVLA